MTEDSIPEGAFINWSKSWSAYRKLTPELVEILEKHQMWVDRGCSGEDRANFRKQDLSKFDFSSTNLRHTNLTGADLCGANIRGADLSFVKSLPRKPH